MICATNDDSASKKFSSPSCCVHENLIWWILRMRGMHIVSRLHQRMEHDEIPQIETYFFSVDNVFSRSLD